MVLVTGGTGLVGAHLLLSLVETHDLVRALHRRSSDLIAVEKVFSYYTANSKELFKKIEWVSCDLLDIGRMEAAFEGVTHVYHCAALISFDPKDWAILNKINVEGTANIVNFCIAKNIQKLCYVSSIAAMGKNLNSDHITEEIEWNLDRAGVYAISKNEAEMEIWRGSQENLPVVIVNPGVILGPGFWNTGSGKLFKIAAEKRRFYPPGGTGFIGVGDVVAIMKKLMDSTIANERFILVSENLAYKTILDRMTTIFGIPGPKWELPIWVLEILWRLDWLRGLIGFKREIPKSTVRSLQRTKLYDNRKIKEALDYSFQPLHEVLTLSCRVFLEERK